jgi:hypothetical protein
MIINIRYESAVGLGPCVSGTWSKLHHLPTLSAALITKLSRCLPGSKGERYSSYSFLILALDGVSGQRHAPAALYRQERIPDTRCIEVWVSLRACLDTEARGRILCLCQVSNRGRPVCNQTLY